MELMTYLRLFRKWLWLVVLGAFLAGGVAFLQASRQPDLYQSRVMIQIGSTLDVANHNYTTFRFAQDLTPTYAVLARSYDIASAAVDAGNFPLSPSGLRARITVGGIEGTSLLNIYVTYTNPDLAAQMANDVARQLIIQSPSNLTQEQEELIQLLTEEINRLNQELAQSRLELSRVDSQLLEATDEDEIATLREQRNTIVNLINQASQNIALQTNTISDLQQRTTSLEIVEEARPGGAMGTNTFSRALLGAITGAALAIGLVLLLEYLDDTIGTPTEVQ
ncbi:MAG: hypothetical protein K8S97_08685, partial [Anaerolineae bacterium]|nr:hypothetical protein [Anaerolineae bacterium]